MALSAVITAVVSLRKHRRCCAPCQRGGKLVAPTSSDLGDRGARLTRHVARRDPTHGKPSRPDEDRARTASYRTSRRAETRRTARACRRSRSCVLGPSQGRASSRAGGSRARKAGRSAKAPHEGNRPQRLPPTGNQKQKEECRWRTHRRSCSSPSATSQPHVSACEPLAEGLTRCSQSGRPSNQEEYDGRRDRQTASRQPR